MIHPLPPPKVIDGEHNLRNFYYLISKGFHYLPREDCGLTADYLFSGLENNGTIVVTFSFAW